MADPKEGFITIGLRAKDLEQGEKLAGTLQKVKAAGEGIEPTEVRTTLTLEDFQLEQGLLQAARRMRSFIDVVRSVRGELAGLADAARDVADRAREALPVGQKFPGYLKPGRVAGVLGPLYGITEEDAIDIYNRNKLKHTVTKFAGLLDKAEYTETIQKQINAAQSTINRLAAQVLGTSGPVLPTGLITQENAAPAQTAALNLLPRLDIEEEVGLYRAAIRKVAQTPAQPPRFEEILPEFLELSQLPPGIQFDALKRIGRKNLPTIIRQPESADDVYEDLRERYGKLRAGEERSPTRQVLPEEEEEPYDIGPPSTYRPGPRVKAARYKKAKKIEEYAQEVLDDPQLIAPPKLQIILDRIDEIKQLPQKAQGFGPLYNLNPSLVKNLEAALRVGSGRISGSYTADLDRLARAFMAQLPSEAFERPDEFPNLATYSAQAFTAGLGPSPQQQETIQQILTERGIKKPLFELPRSTPYPMILSPSVVVKPSPLPGFELPPEVATQATGLYVPESIRKLTNTDISGVLPRPRQEVLLSAEAAFTPKKLERRPVPKITAKSEVEDVLATGLITPTRILSPAKEASALQRLLTYLKGEGGFLQLPELNLRPLEAAAAKLESLVQRIGSAMQRLRAALGGLGEGGFVNLPLWHGSKDPHGLMIHGFDREKSRPDELGRALRLTDIDPFKESSSPARDYSRYAELQLRVQPASGVLEKALRPTTLEDVRAYQRAVDEEYVRLGGTEPKGFGSPLLMQATENVAARYPAIDMRGVADNPELDQSLRQSYPKTGQASWSFPTGHLYMSVKERQIALQWPKTVAAIEAVHHGITYARSRLREGVPEEVHFEAFERSENAILELQRDLRGRAIGQGFTYIPGTGTIGKTPSSLRRSPAELIKSESGFVTVPEINLQILEVGATKLELLAQRIVAAFRRIREAIGGLGEGGFAKFSLQPIAAPKFARDDQQFYHILRDQERIGELFTTIRGSLAHINEVQTYLRIPRENRPGIVGVRQLLQDFLTRHPQVTEISGQRVSGSRRGPAGTAGEQGAYINVLLGKSIQTEPRTNVLAPAQQVQLVPATVPIPLAAELPAPVQVPLIPPIPVRLALPPFVEAEPQAGFTPISPSSIPLQIPAVTTARHSEFGQVLAEQRATIGRLQQSASRVLGPGTLPPIVLPADEEATGGKVKGVLEEQRGVLERLRQTLADESGFARVSKSPLKGAALQTRAASLLRKEYGKFEGESAAEYTIGRATPFLAEELELPKAQARSLLDRLIASKQVPSPSEVRTGLVRARAEAATAKRAAEAQVLEEFNQARGIAGVPQTPLLDVETRAGAATGYAGGRRKIPQAAAAEAAVGVRLPSIAAPTADLEEDRIRAERAAALGPGTETATAKAARLAANVQRLKAAQVIQGPTVQPGETITKIAEKGFEVTGARALPPIPPDQPTLRDLSGTTALGKIADQIRDERGRFMKNLGKATQDIGTDFTKAFPATQPPVAGEEDAAIKAARLNAQRLGNLRKVFKPADTRADFARVFPIPQATLAAAAIQTTDETALVNQLLARQEAQLVAGATKVQSPFGLSTSAAPPRGAGGTAFYSPTLGAGTAPPIIPPQFVSKPGTAMQLYINRTPVLGIAPPSAPPPGGGPSFFGYPLGGGGPQFGEGAQQSSTFYGQPLGGGFGGGPNPPKPPGFFSRLFGGGGEKKPPAPAVDTTSKFGRRFASLGYFTAASAVIYPIASSILESGRDAIALELILKRIQAVYGNHTLGEQLEIKGAVLDSAQKFGLNYKQVAEAAELFAREQVPFDELASDLGAAAVGARAFGLNLNEVANYIIAIRNATHGKVTGEQAINTVAALAVKGAVPPQELIHSIEQLTPLIESEFSPNQGPITDQALIGALTSVGVRQARLTAGQVTNALRFTFSRFGSEESARKIEEISGVQLGTLASSGQELRPLIDILSDLSVAYNNLLETGQSAKAESLIRYLFGARQVGPGTILLKEFAQVMGLAGDATIRTGDAARLAEAQMDSLQARFVVLRNTLTETFSTALADIKPALTGVIDILTAMVQSLGTAVNGWKLLHDAISNTPLPVWAQGAVTGAIPGALIGTVVGGPGLGTLGGAAVGGVIGSANSLPLPKWVKRGLIGGAIGSVVPGVGTLFGAGAGVALGVGTSLLEENEPAQIPIDRAKLRAQALATRFGVSQENLSAAVSRAVQAASATGIAPEQQQGVFTQALSTLLPGIGPNLQAGGLDYIQQVLTNVAAATPDDSKARALTTFAQGLSKVAAAALDLGTAVENFLEHSSKLEKAAKVDTEFFAAVGASGVTARERLNATLKVIREGYELTPNRVLVNGQEAVTGAVPFGDVFQQAAKQYGVDPDLLTSIAARESGFNPTLIHFNKNKTKDYGIGQINDTNFESLGLTAETALDPKVAIPAMARFVANLQKQLGPEATVEDVISAYNAGRTPAGKPRYATPLKGVNQQGQPIEIPQYVNQPYVGSVVAQRNYYKSAAAQVDIIPALENFSKTFPFGSQTFFSSLQQAQQPVTAPTPEAKRLQQEQLARLRTALNDLVKSRKLALATGQDAAADQFLAQFKATGEAYREAALPPLAPIPVSASVVFQKGQRSAPGVEQAQDKNLVLEAQREEETYQQEIAPAFQKLAIFRLGLEERTQRELLNIRLRAERRIGRITKQPEDVQLQEQLEAIAERRVSGASEILQYEREQTVVIQERAQIEHLLPVDIRKAYTELDIEVTKRKEELAATLKVAEATARIAFYEQVITKNLKERDAYLKGIVDTTVRALGNLPHAIEEHKGLGGILGSIITPIGEDIYKQNLGRVNLETIRTAFPGATRGIENVLFGGPSIAERIEAAKKERQDLSDLTFGAVPAKLTDQEITTLTQKYAKESARDQLILAGAQFVGATAGAAIGGHAQGATVGSSVGGLVGAGVGSIIPGIGTVVGGAVGSVLGGLIGGFFGKSKPPPETGDLKIIAQNTGDQVRLLENTNQLLAKNLLSFNVPTGFKLPSYQPSLFGGVAVQRGSGGNTVNNLVKVDVTVDGNNLNSNAIGSSIAQAISDRLELESRSAGTYNSRLVYG